MTALTAVSQASSNNYFQAPVSMRVKGPVRGADVKVQTAVPLLAGLTEIGSNPAHFISNARDHLFSFFGNAGLINFLKAALPFSNELANVLHHSYLPGIYKDNTLHRYGIDMVALSSILWNALDEGGVRGFLKGVGLLLFSFIAPTNFIPFFQKSIANKFPAFNNKFGSLSTGIASIAILEVCVRVWDHFVVPQTEKLLNRLGLVEKKGEPELVPA